MKLVSALALLTLVNGAFAMSAYEKKKKDLMVSRTDTLIEKVGSVRGFLKEEKVGDACEEIRDLLRLYPEHLTGIGTHMDNYKTKVIVARDEALQQLIFFHRQAVVCGQGENGEHVDPKDLDKKLKKISKKLKSHRKLIAKERTDYANEFYYNYEF